MSSYAQRLNIAPTRTDLPKFKLHPDMSPGTLILLDPTHGIGAFDGVPANAGTIPNVVRDQAATLVGSTAANTDMVVDSARDSGSAMLFERSAKGGLHILPSQSAQTTNSNRFVIRPSTTMRTFLHGLVPSSSASAGKGLFISIWYKTTRANITSGFVSYSRSHLAQSTSSSTNYAYHLQASPIAADDLLGYEAVAHANANGSRIAFGVGRHWHGTKPGSGNAVMALYGLGNFDAWATTSNRNKGDGRVVYRIIVEDLAQTARADGTAEAEYAAALAVNTAAFDKAFASGGKFYGDTWTDPATFA